MVRSQSIIYIYLISSQLCSSSCVSLGLKFVCCVCVLCMLCVCCVCVVCVYVCVCMCVCVYVCVCMCVCMCVSAGTQLDRKGTAPCPAHSAEEQRLVPPSHTGLPLPPSAMHGDLLHTLFKHVATSAFGSIMVFLVKCKYTEVLLMTCVIVNSLSHMRYSASRAFPQTFPQ